MRSSGSPGSGSSGKVALAETVGGLRRATTGTVTAGGSAVTPGSVPAALAAGIGLVPQDRHREGLIPLLSVAENATLPIAASFGAFGYVSPTKLDATARTLIDRFDIHDRRAGQPVSTSQEATRRRSCSPGP